MFQWRVPRVVEMNDPVFASRHHQRAIYLSISKINRNVGTTGWPFCINVGRERDTVEV